MEIFVPEVKLSHIYKGHVQNLCSLGEISENPSWKLEIYDYHILQNNTTLCPILG